MFKYVIDQDVEMKMLDINNSEELYNLTNSCREYLREWLPWVDGTKKVEDSKAFIEMTKKQFASNDGFQAGIRETEWLYDHYVDHIVYGMLARQWRTIKINNIKL